MNKGASLFEVIFRPKKYNLILNLGKIENYKYKNQYIGSTCGRYANRISNAQFKINRKKYNLSKNENFNTLHGGKKGFDKKVWDTVYISKTKIIYQLFSKNLDQGFPGNLDVRCEYKINKNKLSCKYSYISDRYTYVNLTNHAYWNLNKNKNLQILNHFIKINSNYYLPVNKYNIPLGKKKLVKSTQYDFRKLSNIGDKTLKGKKGFDINFVTGPRKFHPVAKLVNKKEKIKINISSNQPGLQFYTGHNLSTSKNLGKFKPYQGLCMETQHFPNSPNEKNFPSTLAVPNKKYSLLTSYKFESI